MRKTDKAMTLAELLIATAITSVIGLSAAGVTMAMSTAHAGSQANYANIQTGRSAMIRVQRELNRAKLITAMDDQEIVYWAEDANHDGQMTLSEMAVLEYDPETDALVRHEVVFPANMDPVTRAALDSSLTLGVMTLLGSADNAVVNNARSEKTILAEGVTGFSAEPWPSSPMTKLVQLEMTFGSGTEQMVLRSAAALRASRTGYIDLQDGLYVLNDVLSLVDIALPVGGDDKDKDKKK